jgi:hypothetical protein
MVHTGSEFALGSGDKLVAQANATDAAAIRLKKDDRLKAVLLDFGGIVVVGALRCSVRNHVQA